MSDWPELDDAVQKRKQEREKARLETTASQFVNQLENSLDQEIQLIEQLKPWRRLLPRIREVGHEWGPEVGDLLHQLSVANWSLEPDEYKKLIFEFKLELFSRKIPPQWRWEISMNRFYYRGWYIVNLVMNPHGILKEFQVTCKNERVLRVDPDLESLKDALLDAYEFGPLFDVFRKPEPGISLDRLDQISF